MRMSNVILVLLFVMGFFKASAQFNLIPLPASVAQNDTRFTLNSKTSIYYEKGLKQQAELLSTALSLATGFDFEVTEGKSTANNVISMELDKTISTNEEAYQLSIKENQVVLRGRATGGVFYATQTLLQLLPAQIYSKTRQKNISWIVPGAEIKDAPLYAWRGMMLDVARYFFGKDYVMHFIDMMAMYKMNTLHLHLVDDAGWRLEIKKYPKLTSIGAWRGEGLNRTGGYYTQEDIKELVAYAKERNINIVPEIELPAHTLASIAAYPYLSCTGEQYQVQTQHEISKEILCAGKESTFDFLSDVFRETFALFPSKYIHIGGDEAIYERWKACPQCQKRMQQLGLKNEKQLQVYFNQRVQNIVKKYSKTMVGWDEIIEDGLQEKVVGMIWNDQKKAFKAMEAGHYTIMTLTENCYFDVPESKIPGEVKAATWLAPISLEKVYNLNPMLKGLDEKYRPQVLGASAALWADQFIHGATLQEIPSINENRSEAYFDYLTLPRMTALAEVCWTAVKKQSWTGFEQRMQQHYQKFDQAGYGYRVPQPKLVSNTKSGSGYLLTLHNVVEGAEIRYTTDGTPPNVYSPVYTKPVNISDAVNFSAITVVNRNVYSLPFSISKGN